MIEAFMQILSEREKRRSRFLPAEQIELNARLERRKAIREGYQAAQVRG